MRLRLPFYNMPFVKTAFHIAKDTVLHGPLHAGTSGRIDGLIKGEVGITGKLVIGKGAEIRGDVSAKGLELYGSVYGNIVCTDKVMLYNTAYVKGNITASVIELKEGALVEGVIIKKTEHDDSIERTITHEEEPPVVEEPVLDVEPVPEKSSDQDRDATKWF